MRRSLFQKLFQKRARHEASHKFDRKTLASAGFVLQFLADLPRETLSPRGIPKDLMICLILLIEPSIHLRHPARMIAAWNTRTRHIDQRAVKNLFAAPIGTSRWRTKRDIIFVSLRPGKSAPTRPKAWHRAKSQKCAPLLIYSWLLCWLNELRLND